MRLYRHASRGAGSRLSFSLGQFKIFFKEYFFALDHFRMGNDAFDRTYFDALRLVKMTNAFGAKFWIDFVKLDALIDRIVRTFRLADIAIDALIGNQQRHCYFLIFVFIFCTTNGLTNWLTSPPMVAISRTMLAETNI
jgi:hypothetical protein